MLQSIITIVCAFLAGILSGLICKSKDKCGRNKKFWDFIYRHRLWLRLGMCALIIASYAVGVIYICQNFSYEIKVASFLHCPFVAPAFACALLFFLGYICIYIKEFLKMETCNAIFFWRTAQIKPAANIALNSTLLISFIALAVYLTIFYVVVNGALVLQALNSSMFISAIVVLFIFLGIALFIHISKKAAEVFVNWLKS